DQLAHLPVEERQQQGADVRAVDVGVRHDDDAVIPQLLDGEILGADPGSERRDHRLDRVAAQHLVEACLLDVQDLAPDRQNRLELAIPTLLRRAAGGITLYDIELAERGVALLTVGELPGERAIVQRPLASYEIACLASTF